MKPRILVTGASTFFAARLIHDLGRRGAVVTAADSLRFSAGKASKFTRRTLRLPTLSKDPGPFLEAIIGELKRRRYDLLLPTFEESVLLSEYADDIRRHTRMFLPEFSSVGRLHNKLGLQSFCDTNAIQTPLAMAVRNEKDLLTASNTIGFPIVLKLPSTNGSVGRTYCDNFESLELNFRRLTAQQESRSGEMPFIQKRIEGDLVCNLCFCWQGRKLAEVVYRTQRTFPQSGGTCAHKESIHHPLVSQMSSRLIKESHWSGFIGFDFVVASETGQPYVIDANPRATPAIHLGYLCGIDWTEIIFSLIAGKEPVVNEARAGVHTHTLLLDVGWLLEGLSSRKGLSNFAGRCAQFLTPPWTVNSRDDLISIGEFRSALIVTYQALYSLGKSVFSSQQTGEILLENANYNPGTAAAYRRERQKERSRANENYHARPIRKLSVPCLERSNASNRQNN